MKPEDQNSEKIICRLVQKSDFPQIIDLMAKLKIPIEDLYSRAIYTAIFREALIDERVVFAVAEKEGKLIGLVVALIDRNKFIISFNLKHPILGTQIILKKIIRKLGKGPNGKVLDPEQLEAINKYLTNSNSDRSWWDSSPSIAKALFISIDPDYRGNGIGLELNRYRDEVLIERGVTRYDGYVEIHRVPQFHLLHKTGFRIERRENKFFVSKDLVLNQIQENLQTE